MKKIGAIRKLDPLGRIVIPAETREILGLEEGDKIEFLAQGQEIVLRKYLKSCIFCSSDEDLTTYKKKTLCLHCLAELQDDDIREELMVSMED